MGSASLDWLIWPIVGLAALYVGRSGWRRVQALRAQAQPAAATGISGPLGSTLARPGSPAAGCNGCSGDCGKPAGGC
jgi:hypothetical protein